jgi:hypothetical protein
MTKLGTAFVLATAAACSTAAPDPIVTTARFSGTVQSAAVTHVMAVSAVDEDDVQRVLAPVDGEAFTLELAPARHWVLVFVDARQIGADMVVGTLRAGSLDTFTPRDAVDVELGPIAFHGREALLTDSHADLEGMLGWSSDTLSLMGEVDDLALRYANPDSDDDGTIDAIQERFASLDVQPRYRMLVGSREAIPADLMHAPDAIQLEHAGTSIFVRMPEAFGAVDRDDASVTFEQPFYGTAAGPDTPSVPGGEPITSVTFGDRRTFGVFARPGFELPRGNYRFQSGERTLDFTLVQPPLLGEMTTGRFQLMPRVRLVPSDATCVENCTVNAIEFAWRRRTADGWTPIDDEAALALLPVGALDLVDDRGRHVHFAFPVGVASGEMPWVHLIARTTDPAASITMTTSTIRYAKLSYQTGPGTEMFAYLGGKP